MPWWIRPQFIDVVRLRRAALRYSARGWDVTPGACLAGDRFTCHRPGCPTIGCHPALEHWQEAASCDSVRVGGWWRRLPHTVLLATGRAFDVLEVPGHLGLRVLGLTRLHGHVLGPARLPVVGPLAVTPTGRWMFFVRPGGRMRPELDGHGEVLHHGPGSWVPAPPTRLPQGRVRWAVTPEEVRWRLPESYVVQALLVDAIAATTPVRREYPAHPEHAARAERSGAPPPSVAPAEPVVDAAPADSTAESAPLDPTAEAILAETAMAGPDGPPDPARADRGRRSPTQRTPTARECDPPTAAAVERAQDEGVPSDPRQRAAPGQQPAQADSGPDPGADPDGTTRLPSVPRQASTARRAA